MSYIPRHPLRRLTHLPQKWPASLTLNVLLTSLDIAGLTGGGAGGTGLRFSLTLSGFSPHAAHPSASPPVQTEEGGGSGGLEGATEWIQPRGPP